MVYRIETQRLGLRKWKASDLAPFAEMNGDKRVMEFFPATLTFSESVSMLKRIEDFFERNNFGLWATEIKEGKKFIGFVGLNVPQFQADFMPCTEIGWRLGIDHWGKGYATEAAIACLEYGFTRLRLAEIVSFTSRLNIRSENVMKKIGMQYAGSFEHPFIEEGNKLKTHLLYKKTPWG